LKGHRAAYRELLETLWYASGLEGAKLACRAVAHFLWARDENPELAAPFLMIASSFTDLEQGLEPPLFSKKVAAPRHTILIIPVRQVCNSALPWRNQAEALGGSP